MSKDNVKEGKYEPMLTYTSLLEGVSAVRQYGIKKYGSPNDWWTTEPIHHFNACIRHIRAYMQGEVNDQSSGVHHLAHAISNLMFELERYRQGGGDLPLPEPAERMPRYFAEEGVYEAGEAKPTFSASTNLEKKDE